MNLKIQTVDVEPGEAADKDAEQPLLLLLLEAQKTRRLKPDDFPGAGPLPWPEQKQIIEAALKLGRVDEAANLAVPCGFVWERGWRLEGSLKRWLKGKS